jgi:hypothetical protein
VEDYMEKGVWMVTEDCEETNKRELAVRAGAFVRDAVSDIPVPHNSKFVVAYDGTQGLVPRTRLRKMELHPEAYPPRSPGLQSPVSSPEPDVQPEEELQPEPETNSKPELRQDEGATQDMVLKFFRAVRITNKIGRATVVDFRIGRFVFISGDFLLDGSIGQHGMPTVTDINGKTGQAHSRRLQSLERPWGLPLRIEVLPVNEDGVLEVETTERGKPRTTFIEGHPLPLARLTKCYSAKDANSETEFIDGEIVRVVGWPGPGAVFDIVDFESKVGTVSGKHLEPFGAKPALGNRPFPFGIHTAARLVLPAAEGEGEDKTSGQPCHGKRPRVDDDDTEMELEVKKPKTEG